MPSLRAGERAKGFLVSLATLLVAGLSVPAVAAAWTAPVGLSGPGQDAAEPQLAVDGDGDAVFTWQRFDGTHNRIQARTRSAAGVLGAVQTLSPPGENASDPQVAVEADGDAVFTWTRFDGTSDRIQARARSAAGTLSAVQTLSDPGHNASEPQVAVDAEGDAVFTWVRFDGVKHRIQARTRSAAGVLTAVRTLSDPGQAAFAPQVAVDAGGDAVFTWQRPVPTSPSCCQRVQARARSAVGTLSEVENLSPSGQPASQPQVAVDADGDFVFTWTRFDGTHNRIQGRTRSAVGALSPVQTLSGVGRSAHSPQVAVDTDGDAVFTWLRFDGNHYRAQARSRSSTGALSAAQTLSDSGQNASEAQVGVDSDGDAVFAWRRPDGTSDTCCSRAQARARSAAGVLSAVQTLSDPTQSASSPQIAVDADGDALVTWSRSDGADIRIQASAGP